MKMQTEKSQCEKYEKMFNICDKNIKHVQSLIDEKDIIINNNENKQNTLDEKCSHVTSKLLNHDIIKVEEFNDNNDFVILDLLS